MFCTKATVFLKDKETFIVKKIAVLGSTMAVKVALIKEFQDGEDQGGISFTLKFFEKSCFHHPRNPKKA